MKLIDIIFTIVCVLVAVMITFFFTTIYIRSTIVQKTKFSYEEGKTTCNLSCGHIQKEVIRYDHYMNKCFCEKDGCITQIKIYKDAIRDKLYTDDFNFCVPPERMKP